MSRQKKKILYIINHAAFFVSHRKIIADKASKQGFEAILLTGLGSSDEMEKEAKKVLSQSSIQHFIAPFSSGSVNFIFEFYGFIRLLWLVKKTKPSIIHTASPKGNLYGGLAAVICKVPSLLVSVSGQGFINTKSKTKNISRGILRFIFNSLMKLILRHPNKYIVFQNDNDIRYFIDNFKLQEKSIVRVNGSGVDLNKFNSSQKLKEKIVLLPSRLLNDKGINEFVSAVKIVSKKFKDWRFIIAGSYDYKSPSAVDTKIIEKWKMINNLEITGYVKDIENLFLRTSIVCLPSYREGFPKCLMEASAASCAIITTDVVGCRDAIVPNETGILVNVRDHVDLKNKLDYLISKDGEITRLGINGRKHAEKLFDQEIITDKFISLYNELCENHHYHL